MQKWKQSFPHFKTCSSLPEPDQVSVFLNSIGDAADDILTTVNVDEETITFQDILTKFDNHFGARKNTITARAKFNT